VGRVVPLAVRVLGAAHSIAEKRRQDGSTSRDIQHDVAVVVEHFYCSARWSHRNAIRELSSRVSDTTRMTKCESIEPEPHVHIASIVPLWETSVAAGAPHGKFVAREQLLAVQFGE
jgi:hypothetical protein